MDPHVKTHALIGIAAALLPLFAASCQHKAAYVYADRGAGTPAEGADAKSARVECPKCYRLLTCCTPEQFSIDGEEKPQGVAWACPVHGFVATTPTADVEHKTCAHGIGKEPARLTDPQGVYMPAIILRCKECGAGGQVILEQKGNTRIIYCTD